ncbi:hypothetical protein PC129_g7876 [Phytophthora cactorum]|uniref:Uncharacterized protein n=1 Tax=Phytophthora cactorum TaxID=29920 RepID=A0A8T1I8M3_9STRA|nr:hypothetical protein PC129_g7876 [Phytophthora cactorum]
MSLTVRWLYTLEDPLVRLVNDGGLTRNTVSCSVHYVDVGMWASFSKSLAVLLRRTLWPVVEPGNQPVRPYADQLQLTSFVLLQTVDGVQDEEAAIKLKERRGAGRTTYIILRCSDVAGVRVRAYKLRDYFDLAMCWVLINQAKNVISREKYA